MVFHVNVQRIFLSIPLLASVACVCNLTYKESGTKLCKNAKNSTSKQIRKLLIAQRTLKCIVGKRIDDS